MTRHRDKERRVQRSKVRYPATERELHILLYTQDSDSGNNSNNRGTTKDKDSRPDTRKGNN